jgi:DNA polymerase III subunit epsilon
MPVRSFISLDVETANADFGSICAVGLAHFRDGEFFQQINILVDPEDEFDPLNVGVHGMRPEDVAGKPTMAQVFPVVAAQLNDTIVTHHRQFDRGALARAAHRYGVDNLSCHWMDTPSVAGRTWGELSADGGFGLANLARRHGISFEHHNAAEDARASGLVMVRAMEDSGLDLEDWLDLLGETSDPDVRQIRSRRKEAFVRYARVGSENSRLAGEVIVFTGFLSMHRGEAASLAAAAGCTVADSVTKKTTILVVGDQDLRLTNGQEKSSKHRRAEQLIGKGSSVRIVRESDFMLMVR